MAKVLASWRRCSGKPHGDDTHIGATTESHGQRVVNRTVVPHGHAAVTFQISENRRSKASTNPYPELRIDALRGIDGKRGGDFLGDDARSRNRAANRQTNSEKTLFFSSGYSCTLPSRANRCG